MQIRIVLHVIDEDLLLFEGAPPGQCPPVPRPGDEVVHENRRVRVEGVRHHFGTDCLEIGLFA